MTNSHQFQFSNLPGSAADAQDYCWPDAVLLA